MYYLIDGIFSPPNKQNWLYFDDYIWTYKMSVYLLQKKNK